MAGATLPGARHAGGRAPSTLDEDLSRFPYVNGDLFRGPLRIRLFDAAMRRRCSTPAASTGRNISPAIFGALFQSVMDPKERRAQGAHYTTEKNILKVIEPLFLDDLQAEFARLKARKDGRRLADLRRFQEKLGTAAASSTRPAAAATSSSSPTASCGCWRSR